MFVAAVPVEKTFIGLIRDINILPAESLNSLSERAHSSGVWLGQVLIEEKVCTETELASIIAAGLGIPLVDLSALEPDASALACLPAEVARQYTAVPIRLEGSILQFALANPFDRDLPFILPLPGRFRHEIAVAPVSAINRAIDAWYPILKIGSQLEETEGWSATENAEKVAATCALYRDQLQQMLCAMLCAGASDMHLTVGTRPLFRINGDLQKSPFPLLEPDDLRNLVYSILAESQIDYFERHHEFDFAYSLPGRSHFRVNLFWQRGAIAAIFRAIPPRAPTLNELDMPPIIRELTQRPRGLILVTGPTGSGKSTTLAAMVNEINGSRRAHIVTLEDPIEFVHEHNLCEVNQRQVGADTDSFAIALRHILRQDPDVILIGEMRDQETIAAALTAAETGHLVLSTLHTSSAAQTIDRVIDVFPAHQQNQVRSQLANVMEGVITQVLVKTKDNSARICAQEILVATSSIRNLIREGKIHQIPTMMQAGAKYGMRTLDQALRKLVIEGHIAQQEAELLCTNIEDFKAVGG